MVREASESDYPAIARIQQQCPEAAQWPLGDYSAHRVLIAEHGFCAWRQIARDEAELLNLAVEPSARRTGVASALLAELRKRATGAIFLEVAENNEPALRLYRKHGWKQISIRQGYYSGGKIAAIVMKNSSWYSLG